MSRLPQEAPSPDVTRASLTLETVEGSRMRFGARVGGRAFRLDTGPEAEGPSPMQAVAAALGGCTAMDVISILQKKRAHVTDFEINLSGERAEEHPKRYTSIHLEYVVYGKGIKPNDVERSIQLSEEKYCSARASLNASFSSSFRIVEVDAVNSTAKEARHE